VEWSTDTDLIRRRLKANRTGPGPLLLERNGPGGADVGTGSADVCVTGRTRTRVQVQVTATDRRGEIVVALAQPWYPGLVAQFNGQPIPIYRLNMMQPAVVLPPGSSGELVVLYRPWSLVWGVAVALLTVATVAGALAWQALRRRSAWARALTEQRSVLPSSLKLNTLERPDDCHVVGR
jgi:hypothetical protein